MNTVSQAASKQVAWCMQGWCKIRSNISSSTTTTETCAQTGLRIRREHVGWGSSTILRTPQLKPNWCRPLHTVGLTHKLQSVSVCMSSQPAEAKLVSSL